MQNNNVSFTANIHFLPRSAFNEICKGQWIDHLHAPSAIRSGGDFCSFDVRTCSAVGVSASDGFAAGTHVLDDWESCANSSNIINNLVNKVDNPESALIFGSKDTPDKISRSLFRALKEKLSQKVQNISMFEEHTMFNEQTRFYYSKDDKTWYMCCEYLENGKPKSVESLAELLNAYKKIVIAKTDKLFIKGAQITENDNKEIFSLIA